MKLAHSSSDTHAETQATAKTQPVFGDLIQNLSSFKMGSLTKSLSFSSMFIQHFTAIYPDLFPAACLLKFLLIIEHSV